MLNPIGSIGSWSQIDQHPRLVSQLRDGVPSIHKLVESLLFSLIS